jgi:antitoxin ParD1/3/4
MRSMENTLHIVLPRPIQEWVEAQVRAGGYSTVSDYLCEVLEAEHRRAQRALIDEALQEGLDSGPATPMTAADWNTIRQEGRRRTASRRKAT